MPTCKMLVSLVVAFWLALSALAAATTSSTAQAEDTSILQVAKPHTAQRWVETDAGMEKLSKCLPLEAIPLEGKNLTAREQRALPSVCWRNDLPTNTAAKLARPASRGIPAGVTCNVTKWCDNDDYCSEVCERGSVHIEPWLQNALKTQLAITRNLSFCYATLPGTHNSGITLADGYGNLDPQFQEYFKWIRWVADDAYLRTNDHYFSLTDQLNLGVRSVELDTHEVEGALRIAHCGGYHGEIDLLIDAVNIVAKLLGHPIHWDSETIGCNPSLSSIPVKDQRTFLSALEEIAAWQAQPGNEQEFLVLYLDDQADLGTWGVLPELLLEIQTIFQHEAIFTPADLEQQFNGTWPSIDTLTAAGWRVLFVTGYDYGKVIDPYMFSKEGRHTVCHWTEPDFRVWEGAPACLAEPNPVTGRTLAGTLYRIVTCDLYYGPINCNFLWSPSNEPLLDETTLPDVYKCGLNMPSPDLLTPQLAATTIWSWAPGEPYQPSHEHLAPLLRSVLALRDLAIGWFTGADQAQQCAAISKADGRWRATACSAALPTSCRSANGTWSLQQGPRGQCPEGAAFQLPQHGKENTALHRALQQSRDAATAAWLPLQGPDWKVDGSPLYP